jgi:NitT/TauT family transport system substrate-binding protein
MIGSLEVSTASLGKTSILSTLSLPPRLLAIARAAPLAAAAIMLAQPCAAQLQTINVGVASTSSDAPYFIASKKGYFQEEGLAANFIVFDSAAKAIPSLGIGQVEMAGGATSAGLYNAMKQGVNIRIVADKARNAKGYGFQAIMVRKDLYDSGKVRSLKDFKGLKVAMSAAGNSEAALLDAGLKQHGLSFSDVDPVYLGFPQHVVAFQNGGIDASVTSEPAVSTVLKSGTAVRLIGVDEFYPDFQTAVTFFGEKFIKEKPDLAQKAMRAIVRGMRFYNDALAGGRLAGPNADEVISILVAESNVKDPAIYRAITSHAVDADGQINLQSLQTAWRFFVDAKQIDGSVKLEDVVDMSFAQKAAAALGPYVKKTAQQ